MNFFTLVLFLFLNKSLCCSHNVNDHNDHEYLKVQDDNEDVKNAEDALDKLYNKLDNSILKFYPNMTNKDDQDDEDYQDDQDDEYYQDDDYDDDEDVFNAKEVLDKLYNKLDSIFSNLKFYPNMTIKKIEN